MHPLVHLSIVFWLCTALQCWGRMSSNCLVFHTSGGISSSPAAFIFLIFLSTELSSCVNGPSLISNCLLIILGIGSCVTFGEFPSKFSKCCFHRCIRSCWLVAFSLALAVLFLLLISFTVCQAIQDCLSSTESLILSIWFCKIYNALLSNSIEPKIENILRKNQNVFLRNRSITSKILTTRWILEGVRAKNLEATILFFWIYQGLWLHSQRKDGANSTGLRPTKINRRCHNDAI